MLEDADGSLLVVDTGSWYVQHCPTGKIRVSPAKGAIYCIRYAAKQRPTDPRGLEFQDPESLHVVGVFSSYDAAVDAWRAQAQRTVDDAEMKYVVVHIHKLLTPDD